MGDKVLVVRSDELARQFARQRFKGLPEEEIIRHHASVEVLALDRELAERDPAYRQLMTCTAIHHNYSWLTLPDRSVPDAAPSSGMRSLVIRAPICVGDRAPLFLDGDFATAAACTVDAAVVLADGYDLRLAGLIDDESNDFGRKHLGLVYVARLKRPGVALREQGSSEIALRGIGDLRSERQRFDPWSQILIDHLDAL